MTSPDPSRIRLADPVAMEIFSNRLLTITEEMGNTLIRASFSPNIKERKDCSVALFDHRGRLISQASHIPMHLGSLSGGVATVLQHHALEDLSEGDVFMCNDAYLAGGTHAPDITIVTPIFCEGQCAFFAANIAHHSDVGGSTPGSVTPTAKTVFDEGLRIPLVKVVRGGVLDDDLLAMVIHNSREPEDRLADLKVQISANERGRRLMLNLAGQVGLGSLRKSINDILLYTERRLRRLIAELPDGEGSFRTFLDDDGFGGDPVPIVATVRIAGEDLTIDFTGTGAQARGGYNMPHSAMWACVLYSVKAMLDPDLIANEGMVSAITFTAPKGTIVNPEFPGAVGMRSCTAQPICGAIIGAFYAMVPPERLLAPCNDAMPALVMSGRSRKRPGTYVYVETIGGGVGARHDEDGAEATHVHITNSSNLPAEALENEYPLLVREYALVTDSGGAGRFRGGLGIAREIEALDDETFCYASSERTTIPAPGIGGGGEGSLARVIRNYRQAGETVIPANQPGAPIRAGETIRIETPGAGGFGMPSERPLALLAEDLRSGKFTRERLCADYGEAMVRQAEEWLAGASA
jgi:N-methylhydantoinase B